MAAIARHVVWHRPVFHARARIGAEREQEFAQRPIVARCGEMQRRDVVRARGVDAAPPASSSFTQSASAAPAIAACSGVFAVLFADRADASAPCTSSVFTNAAWP
jgi:hypothetical protein